MALDIFSSKGIIVYCFLDEDEALYNTEIGNVTVMGSTKDDGFLKFIGHKCEAFVAIEDAKQRRKTVKMLNERRKVMPVNAIHEKAVISENAWLGHGNFINAGVVVNTGAKVPSHCVLHSGALIENDVELGEFVQIGAGSIVAAKARIGSGVVIGPGATIATGVTIGKDAQIGPGSVVLQDVEEEDVVFGVPAKPVG